MRLAEAVIEGYDANQKINSFKDFIWALSIVPRILFALIPVACMFWGTVHTLGNPAAPGHAFPVFMLGELYLIYFFYFKDFKELG